MKKYSFVAYVDGKLHYPEVFYPVGFYYGLDTVTLVFVDGNKTFKFEDVRIVITPQNVGPDYPIADIEMSDRLRNFLEGHGFSDLSAFVSFTPSDVIKLKGSFKVVYNELKYLLIQLKIW